MVLTPREQGGVQMDDTLSHVAWHVALVENPRVSLESCLFLYPPSVLSPLKVAAVSRLCLCCSPGSGLRARAQDTEPMGWRRGRNSQQLDTVMSSFSCLFGLSGTGHLPLRDLIENNSEQLIQ